jgi:hypothetical protein
MPEHGGTYKFVSGLYRNDTVRFQAVDLGDTVGLTIEVSEEGESAEMTLTLIQLAEFSTAMYAALSQAGNMAVDQHTRRLLGLIRSGIADHPAKGKDGA